MVVSDRAAFSRNIARFTLLGLVLTTGGCRRSPYDLVAVEGVVTQKGLPLTGVEVVFLPELAAGAPGPRCSGVTDATGRYELRTDAGDRGAVAGVYRVCLYNSVAAPRSDDRSKNPTSESARGVTEASSVPEVVQLPRIYNSFQGTPLRAEVHVGGGERFDIDVRDIPPKRKKRQR